MEHVRCNVIYSTFLTVKQEHSWNTCVVMLFIQLFFVEIFTFLGLKYILENC